MRQDRLRRMQTAAERALGNINLVTEDMYKNVKVDRLPKLVNDQT